MTIGDKEFKKSLKIVLVVLGYSPESTFTLISFKNEFCTFAILETTWI